MEYKIFRNIKLYLKQKSIKKILHIFDMMIWNLRLKAFFQHIDKSKHILTLTIQNSI